MKPYRVLDAVLVGLAWVIFGGLSCWGLAELVEMVAAEGKGLSPLPPPSSTWVRGAVAAAALLIGVAAAIWRLRQPSRSTWRPHLLVAVAVAGIFAAILYVVHVSDERSYLAALPATVQSSDDTLMADGHAACTWLGHHRWGMPPELAPLHRPLRNSRFNSATLDPFNPTEYGSNSTTRYYARYVASIDNQQPARCLS